MLNVLWLQSGGCGGCSMSLLCADTPDFAGLLRRAGVNLLWHPSLSLESGEELTQVLPAEARFVPQLATRALDGEVGSLREVADGAARDGRHGRAQAVSRLETRRHAQHQGTRDAHLREGVTEPHHQRSEPLHCVDALAVGHEVGTPTHVAGTLPQRVRRQERRVHHVVHVRVVERRSAVPDGGLEGALGQLRHHGVQHHAATARSPDATGANGAHTQAARLVRRERRALGRDLGARVEVRRLRGMRQRLVAAVDGVIHDHVDRAHVHQRLHTGRARRAQHVLGAHHVHGIGHAAQRRLGKALFHGGDQRSRVEHRVHPLEGGCDAGEVAQVALEVARARVGRGLGEVERVHLAAERQQPLHERTPEVTAATGHEAAWTNGIDVSHTPCACSC